MHIWPAYAPFKEALDAYIDVARSQPRRYTHPKVNLRFSWRNVYGPEISDLSQHSETAHQILEAKSAMDTLQARALDAQQAFISDPKVQTFYPNVRIHLTIPWQHYEHVSGVVYFSRGVSLEHLAQQFHFGDPDTNGPNRGKHHQDAQNKLEQKLTRLLETPGAPSDPLWTAYKISRTQFLTPFHAPDQASAQTFLDRNALPDEDAKPMVLFPLLPSETDAFLSQTELLSF